MEGKTQAEAGQRNMQIYLWYAVMLSEKSVLPNATFLMHWRPAAAETSQCSLRHALWQSKEV